MNWKLNKVAVTFVTVCGMPARAGPPQDFNSLSSIARVFTVVVAGFRRHDERMNVLLVEDDLDLVDALSRMLASRGFQVVCCADGAEALVMVRRRSFDVVLLDLTLPGMDGLDWLQHVRDGNCRVPVLVMTARAAVEDRVLGLNVG